MKNKITFVIILFIFLSFFTLSHATGPAIITSDILPNSVTLKASGLNPQANYIIFVVEDDPDHNTPYYAGAGIAVTSGVYGFAQASFSGLVAGSYYIGTIQDAQHTNVASVKFGTSLDITNLVHTVDRAQSLYDNAVEGTQHGNYAVGSKATLLKAIDEANCMITNPPAPTKTNPNSLVILADGTVCPISFIQTDINNEVPKLTNAIALFMTQKVASSPWIITTDNLQPTSVNIKLSGLPPSTDFDISVLNLYNNTSTPDYNKTITVKSDTNGLAQASFTGLQVNVSYVASAQDHASALANPTGGVSGTNITFTTPLTPVNPNNPTNNNNIIQNNTANNGKSIVPVCNTKFDSKTGAYLDACNFDFFMKLINNVINFLLVVIASPLAALAIAYAGFIMLTAGGSSEKVTKAKAIFKNIVIGYVIALAAWLIVHTILATLGFNGPMFLSS